MIQMNSPNRNRLTDFQNKVIVTAGKDGEQRQGGMDMYTVLYLKRITSKDLLYCTWNFVQCYVAALMGKELGGEWVHIYVWLSPFAMHLNLSQHCLLISYTPMQNKKLKKKKTLGFQHPGLGFNSWLGNQHPACCATKINFKMFKKKKKLGIYPHPRAS